jgi:hypothetical protein
MTTTYEMDLIPRWKRKSRELDKAVRATGVVIDHLVPHVAALDAMKPCPLPVLGELDKAVDLTAKAARLAAEKVALMHEMLPLDYVHPEHLAECEALADEWNVTLGMIENVRDSWYRSIS